MKKAVIALIASLFIVGNLHAADRGTAKEAMDLVNKAIKYYQENGREKAFAAFHNKKSQFFYKDLYIFAVDWSPMVIAHGAARGFVNNPSTRDLTDSEGKYFIREMADTAKKKGQGWVDYKWTNPTTKKIELKSSYVKKVPGADFLIGCGIYKGESN
ncbi:MAG: cache domain-containing protein [Syntrophales bacterium]